MKITKRDYEWLMEYIECLYKQDSPVREIEGDFVIDLDRGGYEYKWIQKMIGDYKTNKDYYLRIRQKIEDVRVRCYLIHEILCLTQSQ